MKYDFESSLTFSMWNEQLKEAFLRARSGESFIVAGPSLSGKSHWAHAITKQLKKWDYIDASCQRVDALPAYLRLLAPDGTGRKLPSRLSSKKIIIDHSECLTALSIDKLNQTLKAHYQTDRNFGGIQIIFIYNQDRVIDDVVDMNLYLSEDWLVERYRGKFSSLHAIALKNFDIIKTQPSIDLISSFQKKLLLCTRMSHAGWDKNSLQELVKEISFSGIVYPTTQQRLIAEMNRNGAKSVYLPNNTERRLLQDEDVLFKAPSSTVYARGNLIKILSTHVLVKDDYNEVFKIQASKITNWSWIKKDGQWEMKNLEPTHHLPIVPTFCISKGTALKLSTNLGHFSPFDYSESNASLIFSLLGRIAVI